MAVALSWVTETTVMIEINRILCPIDFSPYSDRALRYAMKMAQCCGAEVHVLHVMPLLPPAAASPLAECGRQLTARNLASAVARWQVPKVDVTSELIESADPAAEILECAEALDVDLIVTGSHGRKGVQRVLLGSTVEPLLHKSRRPVLVIPAGLDLTRLEHPVTYAHIICAVDFSAPSLTALVQARSIAEENDAHLTLLNVIEMPPELSNPPPPPAFDIYQVRAAAEAERLTRLRALVPTHARESCTVETAVLEGGASRQILRLAEQQNADLIVLGVHGRHALDLAIFGSNSKDVVTRAHCPVLVVPADRRRRIMRVAS
jgi:nucleotide-binding universal stress UspA family protein